MFTIAGFGMVFVSVIFILLFLWVFMWMTKDNPDLRNWLFFAIFLAALMVYKNLSGLSVFTAFLVGLVMAGFILTIVALVFLPCLDSSDLVKMTRKMLILTLVLGVTSIAANIAQKYILN